MTPLVMTKGHAHGVHAHYWLTEGRQQAACEYTAIPKKAVGENGERRMSNGGCTTERNCGYAI